MNDLSTQRTLHEAIHGDIPHLPQLEELDTQHCRPSVARTYAGYTAGYNESNLGTPGQERRRAKARRESAFRQWFWALMAFALVLGVILVGTNILRPAAAAPLQHDNYHYRQRATSLAVGKSIYLTDPHENCLVAMHKIATGQIIVAHHC